MRKFMKVFAVSALLAGVWACDKKEAADGAPAPEAAEAEAKVEAPKEPPAAAQAFLSVDKFGVEIEVPAGARVIDSGANAMVSVNKPACTLLLSKVTDRSSSFEFTKKNAERNLKEMLEETQTDDGWTLRYVGTSATDPTKEKHGIHMRLKVGEERFDCSRVGDTKEHIDCVQAACKTLRPKG